MINKIEAVSSHRQLDKKQLIRLWLELLKNTGEIERYLLTQLQKNFDSTLTQFDLLAALDRADKPISKTELSQHSSLPVTRRPAGARWRRHRLAGKP